MRCEMSYKNLRCHPFNFSNDPYLSSISHSGVTAQRHGNLQPTLFKTVIEEDVVPHIIRTAVSLSLSLSFQDLHSSKLKLNLVVVDFVTVVLILSVTGLKWTSMRNVILNKSPIIVSKECYFHFFFSV